MDITFPKRNLKLSPISTAGTFFKYKEPYKELFVFWL